MENSLPNWLCFLSFEHCFWVQSNYFVLIFFPLILLLKLTVRWQIEFSFLATFWTNCFVLWKINYISISVYPFGLLAVSDKTVTVWALSFITLLLLGYGKLNTWKLNTWKLNLRKPNTENSTHSKKQKTQHKKTQQRKLNAFQHNYLILFLVNTSFDFNFRNLTNC